jgi:hypothetical protein
MSANFVLDEEKQETVDGLMADLDDTFSDLQNAIDSGDRQQVFMACVQVSNVFHKIRMVYGVTAHQLRTFGLETALLSSAQADNADVITTIYKRVTSKSTQGEVA